MRRMNIAGSDEVSELRVALFEEAVCRDQGNAYAGNDVADNTDGHVDITVRGSWSHTRAETLERLDSQVSATDSAFKSAVLSVINSLKSSTAEIKIDLHLLRTAEASPSQVKSKPCFMYVHVLSDPTPLGTRNNSTGVSTVLQGPTLLACQRGS